MIATYNLFHYISKFKKNVEVAEMIKLWNNYFQKKYDKIVISPGPGNPNQAGNCLKIVKEVIKGYILEFVQATKYWTSFWW